MTNTLKKVLSVLLCAALLFGASPLNGFVGLHWPQINLPSLSSLFASVAHAEDNPTSGTCGDNLTWEYDEATATLTISGTGEMNNYFYAYDNNGVVGTSAPWRLHYQTMQTIVINSGVTSIGSYAFYSCKGLKNATILDSVTNIGESAFYDCTGLTSVTIPNSVTSIGNYAFSKCTGLTSITIPNSVASVGGYSFSGCTGLTNLTIPNSVTSIGNYAFSTVANVIYSGSASGSPWGARAVNGYTEDSIVYADSSKANLLACYSSFQGEIIIPNSVTSIGGAAFLSCIGLTDIVIPNSVTSIGNSAFSGCVALTDIVIPNSVMSIGNSAFYSCVGLTNVTISNCVTSIGDCTFWGCTGLLSITIPDSVTNIGVSAFENCTGLINVTIPDRVTSIGDGAFSSCTGLTNVTISNNVTSIGNGTFNDCSGLASITIPKSVTSVSVDAFSGCTGLTSITVDENNTTYHSANNCLIDTSNKTLVLGCKSSTIPNDGSVLSIGDDAFHGCTGLTSVTIPDSVTSIGSSAFSGCVGLTSITISDSVTNISLGDWYYPSSPFSGCPRLASIVVDDGNPIYHSSGNCLIETASKTLIKGCNSSVIPTDGTVTSICDNAFCNCTELINMTIPNTVTSIGYQAFNYCTGLTSITIPQSVTSIGPRAFDSCSGLTEINYNAASISNLGYSAFSSLGKVEEGVAVTFGDSVKNIPANLFGYQQTIKSVTISDSVKSIGANAFGNGMSIANVVFTGNIGQWRKISIDSNNNALTNANITYLGGANDSGSCGDDLTWLYNLDSHVLTISGTGAMSSYSNSSYDGTSVTTAPWRTYYQSMKSVVIEDGVTSISGSAFYGCSGLTSITIGKSVTSIGNRAFYYCSGLTEIYYNAVSVADLSNSSNVFSGAGTAGTDFTVTFGNSVETIPANLFYNNHNLTSVNIADNVTSIGLRAFYSCTGLTSIIIGKSVSNIGSQAFENCTALTEIYYNAVSVADLPSNSSNPSVFSNVGTAGTGVGVTFGDSVEKIPAYLFKNCSELTSVTIGGNVTSIGASAFSGCTGLTSVTIPDSITSIGSSAFQSCTELTSVTIGRGVASIGNYSFRDCKKLTRINYNATNAANLSSSNSVFTGTGTEATGITVVFGDSVETVPAFLFDSRNTGPIITSVIIGNNVTSIGNFAFVGCTGLTSVTIGSSVTSIGSNAFSGCTGLTTAGPIGGGYDFEFGWESTIPDNAFSNCTGLTSVTIPNSITRIGTSAFIGCTGLTHVNIYDLAAWCEITFSNEQSNPLYYAHNLYLNGELLTELVIPDSVTSIGSYAFRNCTGLTNVAIGNSVTSIGDWAFRGCTSLMSVTIGDSITSIGVSAFVNDDSLTTVYYNAINATGSINSPFSVSSLNTVIVGDGVESLPANLFRGAENIEQVILPRSVKTISKTFLDANCDAIVYCPKGSYAQTCCIRYGWVYGLLDNNSSPEFIIANGALLHYVGSKAQVSLPQVDTIGAGALNGNTQVVSVEVSSATSEIFDEAFSNCPALQRIIIPAGVTFVSAYAFAGSDNVVIYCVEGSYAQQFAMNNGIPYELITVTFNRPEVVLRPNQTLQLNAAYSVALSETDLLWQSNNEDVVTVDNNGLVTAVGYGRATITAANENGLTVQCVVGVTDSDFSLQQTKGELDAATNFLYGLHAGVTADELKNEYFTTNGSCRLDCEGTLATGDKVNLIETTTGVKAAEYTVVIFGDVDGSGWYDGTDAYFVSLIAYGLIPVSALTEAQRTACDVNHDGMIDATDVAIVERAGLLLNDIDQTAPIEELQTDSVYLEYCGLIDQSIEIIEPVQPTQAEETPAAQTVLGWLKALFAFVLNWLLRIF